jgi:spore coat polysaccharide biosynthesis protein SpsF (cytidylyltransferase family)
MSSAYNIIKYKKIGLVLYARTLSKRLPGKILLKLKKKKTVLEFIIDNLKKSKFNKTIILATSNLKADRGIVNLCKKNKINVFRGDHTNVFLRTKDCIKKFELDYVIRICGDRPFFDVKLMDKMIKIILKNEYDIVTNVFPRSYPKGLTCEVAKSKIFTQINHKKLSKNYKEHIFDYFYKKKKYNIFNFKSNFKKDFIGQNFCIDDEKSFLKIKKILNKFEKKKLILNTLNLKKFYEQNR